MIISEPRVRKPSARAREASESSDSDFAAPQTRSQGNIATNAKPRPIAQPKPQTHSKPAPQTQSRPNTPPPRRGTRAVRALTIDSDTNNAQPQPTVKAPRIPAYYSLAPTVPNPFTGTLDASLDAILLFGKWFTAIDVQDDGRGVQHVVDALLQSVDRRTNWPLLLAAMKDSFTDTIRARSVMQELLFLTTRTLLPEQITENRGLTAKLYDRRRNLAHRVTLRYDMLREWKLDASFHPLSVASVAPSKAIKSDGDITMKDAEDEYVRKPLLPNVWATVIAAPEGGFVTHGYRERMKHHVTDLDGYLMLTDEEVSAWKYDVLLAMTAQIVLHWQWLRRNNAILEEMEMNDYEAFDGKGEECEWIVDDPKRIGGNRRESKIKPSELDELGD